MTSDLNHRLKAVEIDASQVAEVALAAYADIASYNAYIEEHGLFADTVRGHAEDNLIR